ncbi:MAG: long-chain fatty acid--CoA ligase [Chloroflexota bacterium]
MEKRRTIAHMQTDRMSSKQSTNSYYAKKDDAWIPITNGEALKASTEMGMGLWSLGVRHKDRIAVMSNSRAEWDLMDNGSLNIGATVVSIYPTSTQDATMYILEHSGAKTAVLESVEHWNLISARLSELPNLEHIVMIDAAGMPSGDWIDLNKLRELGRDYLQENPSTPDEARDQVQPGDLASLMYTSGTTGNPKGVALTHEMLFNVVETLDSMVELNEGDTAVIYLPMSHILQRVNVYLGRFSGLVGYFAPSILDFVETCQAANPMTLSGVPRVFEKIHARVMAGVEQAPPTRQKIFNRALDVGRKRVRLEQANQSVPFGIKLQSRLFERLVYSKLRAGIFGENIEFLTTGAAPISTELLEFYFAIGLPLYEGYGLTETCSPITLNVPEAHKIGTVGKALAGSEVKIAEDGEVLLKGPSVFETYYNNPEATSDSFNEDGWFMTGDIGELDSDGFLKITDRKKFLIITAAGKNIAPAPIEQKLLQHPLIGQVVVHGDKRKFLSALLTLDPEALTVWAEQNGKSGKSPAELAADPDIQVSVNEFVESVNSQVARYETIKKFVILPEEFSIENGYMTPSMKLKRKAIENGYAATIDKMYAG